LDAVRANEIRLFPNPAQNAITLQMNGLQIQTAQVVDLSGRVLSVEAFQNPNGTMQFNIASLANGSYIVRCILQDETILSKRFVKVQ
jgi:hypothetical protein